MVVVRREAPADQEVVRTIQCQAFDQGGGEPVEARLLDGLRVDDGWIPELSLVVEVDGEVVGHSVCSRGWIAPAPATGHDQPLACLGLGPIGIQPDVQHRGLGSALMHAMVGAADAMGEPVIALLGNPEYYSRFGFVPATSVGIEAPDPAWDVFFQALPLAAWEPTMAGKFSYAAPFGNLD